MNDAWAMEDDELWKAALKKLRAFPQLLENADEAGVSHNSHSPSSRRPKRFCRVEYLSSMSPVCVLDVFGTFKVPRWKFGERAG
jgi:hypothetical protein